MIVPPTNVRVLFATKPVDFRKGMDDLAAIVQAESKLEPFSRAILKVPPKLFCDETR
jgi:transposase